MKEYNNKIRVGLDITFIVLGLLFLTGFIVLPTIYIWVQLLFVLIGVLFASLPEQSLRRLGFGMMLFGVYLIMRTVGIIAAPIVLWVFGLSLISIGVINLLGGKKTPDTSAPKEQDNRSA
jgi:hypothetical protein